MLRHASLTRFLIARAGSITAQQMPMLAISWHRYDLTSSAWYLGLVGLFQFVPGLATTLVAGHCAGRMHRGRIVRVLFCRAGGDSNRACRIDIDACGDARFAARAFARARCDSAVSDAGPASTAAGAGSAVRAGTVDGVQHGRAASVRDRRSGAGRFVRICSGAPIVNRRTVASRGLPPLGWLSSTLSHESHVTKSYPKYPYTRRDNDPATARGSTDVVRPIGQRRFPWHHGHEEVAENG